MISDPKRVIVTTEDYASRLNHTLSVHHRDFPEVRAEADSPEDAATRLAELLSRTLDSVSSDWRRVILRDAIEDVRAFAKGCTPESACGPSAIPRREEDSRS